MASADTTHRASSWRYHPDCEQGVAALIEEARQHASHWQDAEANLLRRLADAIEASEAELRRLREGVEALELIAAERQRQIDAEGYTLEHDQEHGPVVLQQAARCYESGVKDGIWPWDPAAFKPKGLLRNLVRAGALYQAAIDVCENDKYAVYLRARRDLMGLRIDEILNEAREMLGVSRG